MRMHILISSYSEAYDIWYITDYFLKKNWKSGVTITLGANGIDRKEFVPKIWNYIIKEKISLFQKV